MQKNIHRTKNDIRTLCEPAGEVNRVPEDLGREGKAILLATNDKEKARRLKAHGWIRSFNSDPETINDVMEDWDPFHSQIGAILTEEGAKVVLYYLRAQADTTADVSRYVGEIGVPQFISQAETVWNNR